MQISALERHRSLMVELKSRHHALSHLIDSGPVSYLDIPVHGNVGDLLIYAGTLSFLRQHGIPVLTTAAHFNCRPRQNAGTILLHGGGNLGDLYPVHQRFRERVVEENLDRRIIILPQTVQFVTEAAFRRAIRIFSRHPDLHICVRDEVSLKIAGSLSPNLLLLPDMAHQLYPLPRCSPASKSGVLSIMRRDIESAGDCPTAEDSSQQEGDWEDVVGAVRHLMIYGARVLASTPIGRMGAAQFAGWWEQFSRRLVDDAISLYSRHESVRTDRLHGHILACLMDIPSIVYDNSYGKNATYIRAWTRGSPLVRLEASCD